ncbi:hypothetical protein L0A91_13630 [Ornithinimicrobium sp. INDO-MA30-4]|nr:hypothetical protein [Ornithinimicrobium sp. INDO-MA30-4]UJH70199.1 hypothetical protein L0A91_13630 [Ornithinimicrobium sp. INDO-MA30-4]
MTTGYLWDEIFGWHDTGSGSMFPADPLAGLQPIAHHVAHPDTKRRMHELVCVSGLIDHLTRVSPRNATDEEILRVHTVDYVERIKRESELPKGGDAGDGISPFGKGAFEIAARGAGSAIAMTEAVVNGDVDNGYALVNPAGHHAIAETGMGFASSTMWQSRPSTPAKSSAWRRSRSSTGTSTMATALRPSLPRTPVC